MSAGWNVLTPPARPVLAGTLFFGVVAFLARLRGTSISLVDGPIYFDHKFLTYLFLFLECFELEVLGWASSWVSSICFRPVGPGSNSETSASS